MKGLTLFEINRETIRIIESIRVLDQISWPEQTEKDFLHAYSKGKKKRFTFSYEKKDYSEEKKALQNLLPLLSIEDPTHIFTSKTIESYINTLTMLECVGTSKFQELSLQEYGSPKHLLFGSQYSHLKTAERFLSSFHDYDHPYIKAPEKNHSSLELKSFLLRESRRILGAETPKFEISESLISKAAAGAGRVRIRSDAKFSQTEFENLLVHEVLTHTLTSINGRSQKGLPLLGYGAPRTTKTQEGLATFSEVITGTMDLVRLKRISLRVIAINMALEGANLYDLFEFFRKNDQSEKESYLSASRIFRGGFPDGGIVFTKDGVYLEGLIRVHSFFRWAFKTRNLELLQLFFVGRLDINDIFLLRSAFQKGIIQHPKYIPDWYRNTDLLAGKMAFSLILNNISLESVEEHYDKKLRSSSAP